MATAQRTSSNVANTTSARVAALKASDPTFAAAMPLEAVVKAKRQPGLRLCQVMQIAMEAYADRPALGQRAREPVTDPVTGRQTVRLLPHFETITYRDLWRRTQAIAAEWHRHEHASLQAGDFMCVLAFTSPDYATLLMAALHLGVVNVPLQTSAPMSQHVAIIAETEPRIVAAGIEYVDAAVDAILNGFAPARLLVFEYDARDDAQRDQLTRARQRLADAKCPTLVETLETIVERGMSLPKAPLFVPAPNENPLTWLFYTSGSTGTPKGVMFTERDSIGTWLHDSGYPAITLSFMPMSHGIGNGYLLLVLGNGGTSYCSPKSDLSTLFEDLALARPTMASLVPRVCELFHHHYLSEVDKRVAAGGDLGTVSDEVKRHLREEILGGRLLSVGCGSASLAPETYEFMESMLGIHMPIGYSSTEMVGTTVLIDWKIQRPPVIAYKLDDVPELGYFKTDKPYPRGELLVKTERFMQGYYKRPDVTAEKVDAEGYYRTGDIMAEIAPDELVYLDRRNNVVKLAQGEFVAISRIEALYMHHPAIRQIYCYGSSARAFLVAVVVPNAELLGMLGSNGEHLAAVKAEIRNALRQIAEEQQLASYEVPRDFIVEREQFSLHNGLLTEVGKHQRPKLRERYADALEALYARLAQDQVNELRSLRSAGSEAPVLQTLLRALQATLGLSRDDVHADARFLDLGGDSLSALSLSLLLEEIFGFEVPVGVIVNPASDIRRLGAYIEARRRSAAKRPTFATVHGPNASCVRAADLALEKFLDAQLITKAATLPRPSGEPRTVLLTGATGFLGSALVMSWLERFHHSGGTVILIVRGADNADAQRRIERTLATDPALLTRFQTLAQNHLEVLAGDLSLPFLGLSEHDWQRLGGSVDLIVHPAAHVNHVLPYQQLFTANVVGTAELIALALTQRMKPIHYVSTLGVTVLGKTLIGEDEDIRAAAPTASIDEGYANGYGLSKWASEVLLREAHDLCALPVSVFRPSMILAHRRYAGQINVPDMFTRLLFSLAVTGVAPATFYASDASQGRPAARYDGLAVDFLADAMTTLGLAAREGYQTFNLASPHEDAVSLDHFVDWMIDAGCTIERIDRYDEWLSRFETAMHALPEEQRNQSLLSILGPYRQHQAAGTRSLVPTQRFRAAAQAAGIEIPHMTADIIRKYVADLRHLKML